jgi:hypothetical protein
MIPTISRLGPLSAARARLGSLPGRLDGPVLFVNDSESLDAPRERRLAAFDGFFSDGFCSESDPLAALVDSLAPWEDPFTLRFLDIFLRSIRLDLDPT